MSAPSLDALDLVVAPYGPDPARPGAPRPVVEVAVGDLDGKPALLRALADALGFPRTSATPGTPCTTS